MCRGITLAKRTCLLGVIVVFLAAASQAVADERSAASESPSISFASVRIVLGMRRRAAEDALHPFFRLEPTRKVVVEDSPGPVDTLAIMSGAEWVGAMRSWTA